jgi:hypothetical protein
MQDVVAVEHRGGHRLWLRFDDGVEGVLDFARLLKFRGMLAPLRDPKYFAKAFVNAESGSVTWPNEADLDTLVLYSKVTGRSIRSLLDNPPPRRRRKPARRRPAKV